MVTEIPIENEESHIQESDASLANEQARFGEKHIKRRAARAAKRLTASSSTETGQRDHRADAPLSPIGSRITYDNDAALHKLESELDLEKEVDLETDSSLRLASGHDSDSLGPGAHRIGLGGVATEDEESCFGEVSVRLTRLIRSEHASGDDRLTCEIPVALAWNVVDHDLVVEEAVEQRVQERLQNMSVVNAVEVTNVRDADNDRNTIKARRCLGRLVQKIFSVKRSLSKRKRKQNDAITMDFFGR
jgi:hypothetical protein